MKYKEGDLIRVKSRKWWEREILLDFPEEMAEECCGEIGEIIEINENNYLPYGVNFGHDWWNFHRNWIEEKVEKINITLWYMKNEI